MPLFSSTKVFASPYSFGSGQCHIHGTWTDEALSATNDLITVVEGLRNLEGCNQLATALDAHLQQIQTNLKTLEAQKEQSNKISNIQDEVLTHRLYSRDPELGAMTSRSMIAGMNELAALTASNTSSFGPASNDTNYTSSKSSTAFMPNFGDQVFRVGQSGIQLTTKLLDSLSAEELKCLSSPNLVGPFFTSLVELSASMVNSGQDFFGRDISDLVKKISNLARTAHFDRIMRDVYWTQFQNSMSCLIDTLSEGYCATMDAKVLFDEEMERLKPISWTWDTTQQLKSWETEKPVQPGDFDKLKRSVFEGYYVLTQQLPVVTAFLERIQRGILPKNHSDADFQNVIQSNTFGYFLHERNIMANWNEARTTISNMTNVESQKSAIADTLKKLARLIVGEPEKEKYGGINFLERVTNLRKVIFQLMGKEIPSEVIGKNGMQIRASDWLDVNYHSFIGDPTTAMLEISKNLDLLLGMANNAAVEYYNYWFIADQPGLMIDSLTGMAYNIPEALEGINQYLGHFAAQKYVDASVLPAVYQTMEKIHRILSQYKTLRDSGMELKRRYGDLDQYPIEQRKVILAEAMAQYKDLIEIFYEEFLILKARSSFLVTRLTSFVKMDYQRRLRDDESNEETDEELLKQIYYATGDAVFERMRLISSKNPTEIESDLLFAQRTYLEAIRSLEDLLRFNFAASIARVKLETEGADTTTAGIFEDSVIRANQASNANYYHKTQAWLAGWIYNGLPEFMRPDDKRRWDYWASDKIYGVTQMLLNPDLYPGLYALHPVRLITKPEAPGVFENSNGSLQKIWGILCIQSLAFKDPTPFYALCKDTVLKSPMIDDKLRQNNPGFPYFDFLDLNYHNALMAYYPEKQKKKASTQRLQLFPDWNHDYPDLKVRQSKNYDSRICSLRQRNRNNYIMFLTQGKYQKQNPFQSTQ